MDNKSLGELIRTKRKEKHMTQGQLASALYVSTNAVSKWELGKNAIDPQNLERLSVLLDIPSSLIFDNQPESSPKPLPLPAPDDVAPTLPAVAENDELIPVETVVIPAADNKTKRKRIYFIISGIGCILIVAAVIICSIWLNHRNSFMIQEEYIAEYEGETACYLIAEYSGELTLEIINEYTNTIRETYEDYFNEVNTIVVLFCQDYFGTDIISSDTADAITVINI